MVQLTQATLPSRIDDEDCLEELLSRPSRALIADLARLDGDIIILGVGGKVGPTLARLAKRAAPAKRIVGVARFSDPNVRARLAAWGIETIVCDLLDRAAVAALPRLPNVIYMAGKKFGTQDDPAFTWAMNTHVPAIVAENFRDSRLVVFSTLCLYPYAPVAGQWLGRVGGTGAGGRVCQLLRGTRAHFPALLPPSRDTGPPAAAQLRHRHALRRAARRGPPGARG